MYITLAIDLTVRLCDRWTPSAEDLVKKVVDSASRIVLGIA
jgi:hypothetical protein